jgi:DNA-binding response OmpR family regulator
MASILLLESDPDVRRLLRILLTELGHSAVALEVEQEVPAGTDCLLLDPVSRIHLDQARRARDADPSLAIVYTSFLKDEDRFLMSGPSIYLQKPFTGDDLDASISLALARRPQPVNRTAPA